jgi:hypothetical protein
MTLSLQSENNTVINKLVLPRGENLYQWEVEVLGKGVGGWIGTKQCVHMYVNTKMTPVKTTPRMEEESDEGEW